MPFDKKTEDRRGDCKKKKSYPRKKETKKKGVDSFVWGRKFHFLLLIV